MSRSNEVPTFDPVTRTRFHPGLRLETWHPQGMLDIVLATTIAHYIGFEEAVADEPFNRFSDLSGLWAIRLDFQEIADLVALRRDSYKGGAAVKSAVLATSPAAYGAATMFAAMMESSPIEVWVFQNATPAADWLGVPEEALRVDE
jgi:hypothetical protein